MGGVVMISRRAILLLTVFLFSCMLISALENSEIRELLDATTVRVDLLDENQEIYSFGSGFFVSETGLILTNFHVIEDNLRYGLPIRVKLQNGSTYEADILHFGARRDWAVLQIYSQNKFPFLEFSTEAEILDDIWAAGYPITGNFKITAGMINSYQPDFLGEGLDYYDVSMNFDGGNSGGPVINRDGDVVGMVVAYYTEARAFDFIIPIGEIAEEIYWLRYIYNSVGFIPSYISGVEEVGYLSDFFRITNATGTDIWYLYAMTDEMWDADDFGDDVLGEDILYDGYYYDVDPYVYDWLYDPVYVSYDQLVRIVAEDEAGNYYLTDWYPDSDPWDIVLTADDGIENFVPGSRESAEPEDIAYHSDFFRITNDIGYDIWYLYAMTDEMWDNEELGDDLLGDDILLDGYYVDIDPEINEWLYDPVYSGTEQRIRILAEDDYGDFYLREWYPDTDQWNVIFTVEDWTTEPEQ